MELSLLIEESAAFPVNLGHLRVYKGALAGREVLLALTGIGKVNAASAATILLQSFKPSLMINTGCGGAFAGSGLSICDLAVASTESLADEGVQTPEGWMGFDLIGIPAVKVGDARYFNTFPLTESVARDALARAERHGFRAMIGPFLTVSTCSGTACQGEELLRRFPGICENMEGAAVAQVAVMYGVPLLEVRGISNFVEDRDVSRWDLKGAVIRAQEFLLAYLKDSSLPF